MTWTFPAMQGGSERHLKGFPTVSFVVPGGYWDNLFRFGLLMRNDQTGGRLALGTNMDFYPGLALEDLGKAVVQ